MSCGKLAGQQILLGVIFIGAAVYCMVLPDELEKLYLNGTPTASSRVLARMVGSLLGVVGGLVLSGPMTKCAAETMIVAHILVAALEIYANTTQEFNPYLAVDSVVCFVILGISFSLRQAAINASGSAAKQK